MKIELLARRRNSRVPPKKRLAKQLAMRNCRWDGKADKVEGKIQNAMGGLKDALKSE